MGRAGPAGVGSGWPRAGFMSGLWHCEPQPLLYPTLSEARTNSASTRGGVDLAPGCVGAPPRPRRPLSGPGPLLRLWSPLGMEGESVGHLLAGRGRCPRVPSAGLAARPLSGEGFWPSESHCGTSRYRTTVTQAGPETSWPAGGSAHLRGLWPCRRGRLRPCWTRLLSSGGPESQYVWLSRAFSAWSRVGRSPVVHGPCGKGALDWSGSLSPGLVFGHHWGCCAGDP